MRGLPVLSIKDATFYRGELHLHQNMLRICVFSVTPSFYRLILYLCREFVENYGNKWHLKRQCLPLGLISDGVNTMPHLSDSAPSVLAALGGVRQPCQCVSQFNSIKRRFKLQIKMQITSVITASESTGRDKVHPSFYCQPLWRTNLFLM